MNNEFEYKPALGFGGLASLTWLAVAFTRLNRYRIYLAAAATRVGQDRVDVLRFGGSYLVDGIWALVAALVFGFVLWMLYRATWHSWDWATAVVGGAAVLSSLVFCAIVAGGQQRVMAFIPFGLVPYWLLLYRPGVKRACGVATHEEPRLDEIVAQGLPVDAEREQKELDGLYQSLRVYELERGIDTDTFVSRYAKGLEDESPDNEEWFALARLARRSRERLAEQNGHGPS